MIKLISLKCPECSARLSIEEDRKFCFCQYCGTKIIVDDGATTHTYRKIDEARIKEAEIAASIRFRELDIEERQRDADEKTKQVKIKASIILGIIGSILMFLGFACGEASGNPDSPLFFLSFLGMFALMAIFFIWVAGKTTDTKE